LPYTHSNQPAPDPKEMNFSYYNFLFLSKENLFSPRNPSEAKEKLGNFSLNDLRFGARTRKLIHILAVSRLCGTKEEKSFPGEVCDDDEYLHYARKFPYINFNFACLIEKRASATREILL
jgi:hypothetical protein